MNNKDALVIAIDQLESTAAMLGVLLEDVNAIAPQPVKDRICKELGEIFRCLREIDPAS